MMTERYPPMNIVVEDKQRSRLQSTLVAAGKNNKYNTTSVRSFVSELTLSEIDGESDIYDPFMEGSLHDHKPGIPQRRRSESVLSMNEENLKTIAGAAAATTDAAPCMPSRQRSVISGGESEAGGLDSKKSDGSNSTSEPVPEYLQPAFTEEIESTLKALYDKAEIFKRIVDLRDRKYGLRTYKNCFIGSEGVDRMIEAGLANTRAEAIELGRNFIKYLGLFRHVTNGHDFKDRYLFFEFKNNSSKSNNNKLARKWNSAPPRTNGPWYSLRERDTTIVEGQPMSQQDMDRSSQHH